ncbi:antibiotic biosynthesis monooxygenase family protein [Pseudoduganella namucuonensis]|uniref:Heme-degrading monooxygenase HmoA n=1 Tax=Pseudoduganella namucuonensis TaxID=1035707 RepID=A0A1I7KS01_9BURK|nr:antibiotic biosynthesis monooxygenase [Pseudoduganella namucuonensis]SFV00168.1 Heme-degrading monooxygenase HmoA [Pseudoduganella namucuonensis]
MFLSISRFAVANDLDGAVRDAFIARPHLVDTAPGFIRMEVANPCADEKEFWLLTWWRDAASFDAWHHSHSYRESHRGIPKGLKLAKGRTEMLRLDVVAA